MAEQPPSSDRFSDYVNTYYSQLTGGTPKPSGPVEFPKLPAPKQRLGFLGRTVDILSRPMRIISNPVMKAVELPERMDTVKELRLSGQDEAATKEALNAVGSLIAAPFTGFFSDDPANKPYWSDIIEKSVDVQNRNDPKYRDVANNADPVAKGVVGFIGDVLLDPLWLVPGGWAAKIGKEAAVGTKAVVEGAEAARAVAAGKIPEAALLPTMTNVQRLSAVEPVLRASENTFDLVKTVRGKQKTQNFATRAEAEQAMRKSRAKNKQIVPKATAVADTFPAAQASEKIVNDLAVAAAKGGATASETVTKSLREIINAKQVSVGGKPVGLRGELESFFESLKKAAPAPKAKAGKPVAFAKWSESALADKKIAGSKLAVSRDSDLFGPLGSAPTLRHVIDTYKSTRLPEIKREIERTLLRPAYDRYVTGVKAGKGVDLLGNAANPTARIQEAAEASVAATVVRNLKNLDDAARARGAALLGDDLFANIERFNASAMHKFLDDIDAVLKETGAVDSIGPVGAQTMLGRVLSLFDSDPVLRQAAEAGMDRNIRNIPNATPENVAERVRTMGQTAGMTDLVISLFKARGIEDNLANRAIAIKDAVAEVLPDLIRAKLDSKYQKAVYKYKRKDALKTVPEFGKGRAVIPKDPNSGFQAELVKDLQIALAKYYKLGPDDTPFLGFPTGKEFKGDKFIAEKERDTLIALELAEELLKQQGLALNFKLNGVSSQITISQAYRAISQAMGETSRWLRSAMFNAFSPVGPKGVRKQAELFDGTLPFNVLADAVSMKLAGGTVDDIKGVLMSKTSAAGVSIVNGLADSAMAGRSIKVGQSKLSAKQMVENIAKGIDAAGPEFVNIVAKNAKEYTERGLVEGKQLTAETAEIIADLFKSPEKVAAQIRVAAAPEKIVEDLASVVPTTELGQTIAGGVITASIGPEVSKTAQAVENLATATGAGDKAKVAKLQEDLANDSARTAQRFTDDAARIVDELRKSGSPYDEIVDDVADEFALGSTRPMDRAATQGRGTVVANTIRFIDPLKRFFDAKYGMNVKEMLWGSRLFFAQGNVMAMLNKPYLQSLKTLMRNNDYATPLVAGGKETVLQRAFKNVQNGIKSAEGSVLRKAEDDIRPMMARFFDQTDELQNVLLGNTFFRTGAGREAINAVLDYNAVLGRNSDGVAKVPPTGIFFDEDLAVKTATEAAARLGRKPTEAEISQALLNQWKTWDVPDPIGFMYSINRAMVQLASEVSFVSAFRAKAKQLGLASSKPKKGFVKIVPGEDSRYGKLLGDEPLYMDREAAEMFQAIDNFAKSTKQFEGGFGKFVRTTLDPITDTWKYAITLPRPGHHIRNLIGDMVLTFLAEGSIGSAVATRKAFQLMAAKGSYSDIDIAAALSRSGITDIPKDTSVISSGQLGSFTVDDIYRGLFLDRGIIIPARQREGLLARGGLGPDDVMADDFVESNRLSRGLEKGLAVTSFGIAARGGRVEDFITNVAEGRDTFIRMQHAMQMLEKAQQGKKLTRGFGQVVDPKKLSKDELFDLIAERVSKYHPDASTLSIQEKKYLRRIMPFYHWNRGAIQAVLETLVMNPGRVVIFNKASYNIAVATGINPDSLYDPFPDDQLFPSFLQDQMEGPQFEIDGRYYGVKPGITTFDVFNQFASANPIDTVLDNANPALKIPIELLTGARLGTQSRIRDYSDYLDSSIPGLNYAANISGQSVTGSLYSLLTRGSFDPQYQFEVGNKEGRDQFISALNWVTGLGLTDYSRPSYIRIAEQEQQQQNQPGGDF